MDGGTSLESTARERAASVGLACGVDRPVDVEHTLEEPRGLAGARGQAQGVPSPLRGAGRMQRNLHPYCAARLVSVVLYGLVLASCATRLPVVATPIYPSYPFPTVLPELAGTPAAAEHERAWSLLQAGDLDAAERRFATVLLSSPEFHPSAAGLGYVGLARGEAEQAVAWFDQAIWQTADYVPALLGRGEALLVADRVDDAIESFRAALVADPGLTLLRQRVEELRFSGLMDQVARARGASAAGRDAEARAAYERVIAASPESGFLYIELAEGRAPPGRHGCGARAARSRRGARPGCRGGLGTHVRNLPRPGRSRPGGTGHVTSRRDRPDGGYDAVADRSGGPAARGAPAA